MKCFKLLLICLVHLAIIAAMIYMVITLQDGAWGFLIFLGCVSLTITLNLELDRE